MHEALGLSLSLGRKKKIWLKDTFFSRCSTTLIVPKQLPGYCHWELARGRPQAIDVDREKVCKGLILGPNWKNIAMTHLPKVL